MERYNPFASAAGDIEDPAPFSTSFNNTVANSINSPTRKTVQIASSIKSFDSNDDSKIIAKEDKDEEDRLDKVPIPIEKPDYSTSFPDPLGDVLLDSEAAEAAKLAARVHSFAPSLSTENSDAKHRARSSTTTSRTSASIDDPISVSGTNKRRSDSPTATGKMPIGTATTSSGGFSSFLSRATSVTTSSAISDRVSGAMGGMLNAVDTISNQIQQVVPSNLNLNERLSNTATNLIGSGDQLASKFSSSNSQAFASISRQRVILIVDDPASTDWINKFGQYSKLLNTPQTSGLQAHGQALMSSIVKTSSSLLSYNSASSSTSNFNSTIEFDGDLIIQADYRDISVLANQTTGLATVCIITNRSDTSNAVNPLDPSLNTTNSPTNYNNNNASFKSRNNVSNRQQQQSPNLVMGNQRNIATSSTMNIGSSSVSPSSSSLPPLSQHHLQQQTNSLSNNPYNNSPNYRTIRPEYVVVRQRARKLGTAGSDKEQTILSQIVKSLDYSAIPMFEEPEIWSTFQDRQMIFTRLLRIQRFLGRENFPLIPQVFCQTHYDLINYIQQSSANITFPCNVILGNPCTSHANYGLGNCVEAGGKIRVDSMEMLRQFCTIMMTSGLPCTIEPYLDVKSDMIIQKLGTNLKVYRKNVNSAPSNQPLRSPLLANNNNKSTLADADSITSAPNKSSLDNNNIQQDQPQQPTRQSAPKLGLGGRQSSLVGSGTKVLSNLISGGDKQTTADQRSDSNQSNNPWSSYERVNSDVSTRHRAWLEAISKEFANKLTVFSVNIVITNDDREYVVGLNNSSMDFVGSTSNQDEDKRSFVELIVGHMNQILPKQGQTVPKSPLGLRGRPMESGSLLGSPTGLAKADSNSGNPLSPSAYQQSQIDKTINNYTHGQTQQKHNTSSGFRTTYNQQQHNLCSDNGKSPNSFHQRPYGQLSNRSQSVIMNHDNDKDFSAYSRENNYRLRGSSFNRRSSERSNERDDVDVARSVTGLNDSTLSIEPRDTTASYTGSSTMSVSSTQLNDSKQTINNNNPNNNNNTLFGQSLFDSTSTAFNSFQRQSLSFFRRLDSRTGQDLIMSSTNTPPQSAKSDRAFQHGDQGRSGSGSAGTGGFKSQSVDSSEAPYLRSRPPKPPPPAGGSLRKARQSSLASGSPTKHPRASNYATTTTPNSTRQNSLSGSNLNNQENSPLQTFDQESFGRNRVIRQNSALSAFEPFDENVSRQLINNDQISATSSTQQEQQQIQQQHKPLSYDSGSITSGDSSSTGCDNSGTAAPEDTMKNLKKTFASIFGDKQVE